MEIKSLLREPFRNTVSYTPGGKKLEMKPGITEIIGLNANENQLGPSPKAVAAIEEQAKLSNFYSFTFNQSGQVREAFASHEGVGMDMISITAGSSGLILALGDLFLEYGDEVISCEPTYGSYKSTTQRAGAKFVTVPLINQGYDLQGMLGLITPKTKMAVIVNPNNPTGTLIPQKDMDEFMAKVPDNIIVVVDEAYLEWANVEGYESCTKYIKEGKKNVVVLRTFSKLHALAGARVGYSISSPEITQYLRTFEFSSGASRPSLAGAVASLSDKEYMERSLKNNTEGRAYLTEVLKEVGFDVTPSYTSFIYFYPHGITSEDLVSELASYGVMIRQFDDYARVSIGVPHQNEVFAKTLKLIMTDKK